MSLSPVLWPLNAIESILYTGVPTQINTAHSVPSYCLKACFHISLPPTCKSTYRSAYCMPLQKTSYDSWFSDVLIYCIATKIVSVSTKV